jgi:glucose/arabinose dehydrogenase
VRRLTFVVASAFLISACYSMRPSDGGGQTSFEPPRQLNPADVALPAGYRIEVAASGLTFPTGVAFDGQGRPYVTESGYSYGEVFTTPRLVRIEPNGRATVIATGGRNGPWNGLTFSNGSFYVAEGGELEGGRILRITPDGHVTAIVSGLPSKGDHHTDGPAAGPDGWIYFGQGTATNSGVVGPDNADFGWLKREPAFHDIPCKDITLRGQNFTSANPITGGDQQVSTGAYLPFGTASSPGQVVRGAIPCSGAIMRVRPEGGTPELVAWGLRNPFGLAFSPAGELYITENMYDIRGSRPIFGAGDLLRRIRPGTWYGWPDFYGNERLDNADRFGPPGKGAPPLLLSNYPDIPPEPVARLPVHSSSNGFDFSRNPAFGHVGDAFIAQFGDQTPVTGKVTSPVGFKVVRVNAQTGVSEDFIVNRGPVNGPASYLKTAGIERPLAARFDPAGDALYVVDFGIMTMTERGPQPRQGTGVVWRVVRSGP